MTTLFRAARGIVEQLSGSSRTGCRAIPVATSDTALHLFAHPVLMIGGQLDS